MKEKRTSAAGFMYKNKFHVFGGYDGTISNQNISLSISKTTELISIDGGVEYGPELLYAVEYHAITSINSTVSILSGGKVTHPKYYKHLKKGAHQSHLGRKKMGWFLAD